MSIPSIVGHAGLVIALLLACVPTHAQTVAPAGQTPSISQAQETFIRSTLAPGATPRTLSLVLLSGQTGGPGTATDVPASVRKALDDLKGFLPFTTYTLLDSSIIAAPTSLASATQRLSGPDKTSLEVSVNGSKSGARYFDVVLREPNVVNPSESVLSATVQLTAGETIVVGTSRVRGDKALILLLTGVPASTALTNVTPQTFAWASPRSRFRQTPLSDMSNAPDGDRSFADALAKSATVAFDMTQTVTVTGVVSAVTPLNRAMAHAVILSQTTGGRSTSWAVLMRSRATELKPGSTVTVTGWPARDGSRRMESSIDRITQVSPPPAKTTAPAK